MSFRINKGVFQFKDTVSDTFINKFKIDDRGDMVEVDEEGNKVTAYMRLGDKAHDADLLDGIDSGAFLRSNADDNVTGHTEWQDNYQVRLGSGADLRIWHDGNNHVFRSYHHGANYYFQLEDNEGTNRNAIQLVGNTSRSYVILYEDGNERLRTTSDGVQIGKLSVGATTGTWVTSNAMADSIGWNTSYGVYIGSNIGGTHYLRGNGTFTTGGNTYNLWHEGTISTSEVAALKTSLGVTGLPYSCDIFVEGDPNLYYPVHFMGGDQNVWRRIIIKRSYSEAAPSDWNTATHKGGLLLDWEGNFGGWGGATYSDRLRAFNESYTTICASMYRTTHSMGYTFFLRGGGAVYHIYSDQAINGRGQSGSPDIAYDTDFFFYSHSNTSYNVPAPAPMDRQDAGRISELRTLKRSELDAIYQPTGSYLTTSGKAADSDKLDGINSTSFLRSDANDSFSGTLTSTKNGTAIVMDGGASAEGLRVKADSTTTYPVFLRSIAASNGETSPWIYKENTTSWGIWHNNPLNSFDFTRSSNNLGIENNVGGQTNSVMIRLNNTDGSGIFKGNVTASSFIGNATTATTAANLGSYYYADSWFRAKGDSTTVKFFGNSRMMVFRTDGEGGDTGHTGYAFKWTYGGDGTGNSLMLLNGNGDLWTKSYGWLHSRFETAGAVDSAKEELIPLITTAQTAADNAETAAINAQNTADTAETRANSAREAAAAAQATADGKLGATAKAADSNLLDGIDSSAFIRENQDRRHKVIRFTGESGDSGNGVINYGIYQEGGAWAHPYPDLVIGMHTGIKIGGHKGYGGTRFYSDAPGRGGAVELFSVGNGDTHVRVANNLHIGSAGGWITDLLNAKETAGAAAAVNTALSEELGNVTTAVTDNTTQISNNRTAILEKLGATAKAADSEAVDGVDSSRIVYGANAKRSTRYDQAGIVSPNQNSGFYYGYRPEGAPFTEWWNWLTVAGASWTSGNNYDFKLAHNFHADDFYVSRMTNGVQADWRKVWDSGNFDPATKSDTSHNHSTLYAGHGYINSGDWNTYSSPHGSDSTFGGGIYRVESSAANPPASGVYNWSLYQQGNTSRGSQIAVGAYAGGNRLYFRGSNQTANAYRNWAEVWHTDNFDPAAKANVSHDHNDLYYTKAQSNSNYDSAGSASTAQTNATNAANDRFDNEVMPQVQTNATNIARNATDIANKAAAGGSYSQDFAADDMRVDQWFRNTVSGKGLYNEATGQHWYSDDDDYWNVAGGSAANGIRFRDEHGGTIRGYFYANNSNQVGILDAGGSWAIRHTNDSATEFYDADERVFSIGQGGHGSNYGTVCTHGGGRGGWEGYSINERFVWMSSDNTLCGMYNDMDNEWMTQYHRNGAVKLYHNGGLRLETQSGGAKVHGTMTATAFSGSLDWANVTNKPTIPAATPPVQATVEGGPDSTLVSIAFSPGEGAATFTLADGQSFRLAFAR